MNENIIKALKEALPKASRKQLELLSAHYEGAAENEEAAIEAAKEGGEALLRMLNAFGDFRADKATKELEALKRAQLQGGTAAPTPTEKPEEGAQEAEALKALQAQIDALKDALQASQGEALRATRSAELKNIIAEMPDYLARPYARLNLEALNAEEYADFIAQVKADAAAYADDARAKGSVFTIPKNGTKRTAPDEATKAEVDELVGRLNIH